MCGYFPIKIDGELFYVNHANVAAVKAILIDPDEDIFEYVVHLVHPVNGHDALPLHQDDFNNFFSPFCD